MADRKNVRNPRSPLFRKLTRFLSGPIVNYRVEFPKKLKRRQLDQYKFKSARGQEFKKAAFNPFESVQFDHMANQNRFMRYADFDQMEYTPEIASALDIYSDEITTSSLFTNMLNISCPNDEIKTILETLFFNVLNVDFNLFGWTRTMCKYGDLFLYMDIDEGLGITHVIALPGQEIERLEGEDRTNPNYIQFQWNSGGLTFENWQVAHFRVLGDNHYFPYGLSVLEPCRRIFRQLILLEDAMMAYRIVRSPERRVFYVDVGNIPPNEVEAYMQKIITTTKRNQVVDPNSGKVDLRYNPLSIEEDYYIPVKGTHQASKIETLPAGQMTGDIDDVKYLRDKLFTALKIPQSYLTAGEEGSEDKTTLAQKDIRFARTIQRLQRSVISELEKVAIVHLFTLGYRGDDLISFDLSLNNPSRIAELQELEHWKTKFDVAQSATEGFFSRRWVAQNIFNLSEEEYLRNQREMFHDRKFEALLEKASSQFEDDPEGGGDMLGDMNLDDMGGAMEMEPEEAEGMALEPEPERASDVDSEGDSALLAAPAKRRKRNKNGYTTPSSNGKSYKPVRVDKRDAGARLRSNKSKYSAEAGSSAARNIFKGIELTSLAKGIYEDKSSTYKEELELITTTNEINVLMESLKQIELKNKQEKDEENA